MQKEYGVKWIEANASGQLAGKTKFFSSEKQRERFVEKLVEKDGFIEIDSWCG